MPSPLSQTELSLVQLEQAVAFFTRARPRLFGIAYRILANADDADDIVQDAWMRWQGCDRGAVQAPPAFLATTATRLAINAIQSARARHETYLDSEQSGRSDSGVDPELEAEQREALESALIVLLETLSPAERAAYVLREVFQYPYEHVGELIEATEAATRQLVSRARKRLAAERRRSIERPECRPLLTAFLAATQSGQVTVLEHLLVNDVINYTNRAAGSRTGRTPAMSRSSVLKFPRSIAA